MDSKDEKEEKEFGLDEYQDSETESEDLSWRRRDPTLSARAPCGGTCGKQYTLGTLRRHDGMCSRCFDQWLQRSGGHYTEANALNKGFYKASKSTLDDRVSGDEHLEGRGYSRADLRTAHQALRPLATADDEEQDSDPDDELDRKHVDTSTESDEEEADRKQSDSEEEDSEANDELDRKHVDTPDAKGGSTESDEEEDVKATDEVDPQPDSPRITRSGKRFAKTPPNSPVTPKRRRIAVEEDLE